ncbi:hypothetical protein ACJD0Z_06595 [Flavobacteriaceae bacterium M23B6Z8]
MRLRLIFSQNQSIDNELKSYIKIFKNKIHFYEGIHPLHNEIGANKKNGRKVINSTFEIFKLDKLDREVLKTKATHKIISQKLHNTLKCQPYFIKLNTYQEFIIKWYQKYYIIQSLEFKKNILVAIVGAIIGSIATISFQKLTIPNHKEIQSSQNNKTEMKKNGTDSHVKTSEPDTVYKLNKPDSTNISLK